MKMIASIVSISAMICVYLFATAPVPLPELQAKAASANATVPVSELFDAVNMINAKTRQIWTARIVGKGTEAGLKFEEHWLDDGEEAGPLPALFVRLTAQNLEKQKSSLALFLGSDQPINKANLFQGEQVAQFAAIQQDRNPRYFSMARMGIEVGMYPDLASAPGCVSCHNQHESSAKKDWKLNDVMGATTWTYPSDKISESELHEYVGQIYTAIQKSYETYIDRARKFSAKVNIGKEWPEKDNLALPDSATFMDAILEATAPSVNKKIYLKTAAVQK
ncbi:MAG TPA: DUF3365 domain-containing protein [Bradyrhizobium sp.]|nr:DUF3365 domain-containing protein [Bradyrhizobium sp.]